MVNMLDKYNSHRQIRNMSFEEMDLFAKDIRKFLIENVSKTGGHLASNLGVVELTLSLYKVFDLDRDKVIWDVGHQAYVHKILTGRKDEFSTLRQYKGISGFPKKNESIYDFFETGHSSTSISAALGMARARDLNKKRYNVVSVIGDGALTGGMALEALNDVGFKKTKIIIILNDNQMSISQNVGGLSTYLSKIRIDPNYNKLKNEFNTTMEKTSLGKGVVTSINKIKGSIKQFIVPGMLFEDMGIKYLGPIDGHDIRELSRVMSMAKDLEEPVIIHVITKKGKGYDFAEKNPNKFHGIGPFNCGSGEICSASGNSYSKVFGEEMVNLAKEDKSIVAITAAMPDGTGLKEFSKMFPDRFFDVGIAEQHAVTLAAGMASEGLKPVFAVYSTFLQRAFDQVLHDVCIQKLPVVFAIDRAGIVGEDGETHQGIFDISYLSCIPNMTIMAPKCLDELRIMIRWAVNQKFPVAIRYPRGGEDKDIELKPLESIVKGKWEILNSQGNIAIIASGKMVEHAKKAQDKLNSMEIKTTLINASFIKPIDIKLLESLAENGYKILTIEDNILIGGLGYNILSYINSLGKDIKVINMGFKDEFIPHGDVDILYREFNLDAESIVQNVIKLNNL